MLQRVWMGIGPVLLVAGPVPGAEGGEAANPVTVDPWQAIYTIVVFLVLLCVLGKFGFPRILEGLKQREEFIRRSLEDAEKSREQAAAALKEYEAKLVHARLEATAIVEEARRDADVVRRRIEDETRASSEAMIDRARREIGLARDEALAAIFRQSADLASSLAASALSRQMSPEEHQRLVLDSLRELQARERNAN